MPIPLGDLGVVPTHTILQGAINFGVVKGVATSNWDPRTGGSTTIVYTGTQEQITLLGASAQFDGLVYRITGGKVFKIEITFPLDIIVNNIGQEPIPISFWELTNHTIDRSILELNDRPFISALPLETKQFIELKLKNPVANINVSSGDPANFVNARIAYNLKLIGIEGKATPVPVLKRSAIFSNSFNLSTVSNWNVKRPNGQTSDLTVMTTQELVQNYGLSPNPLADIPLYIRSQMPTYLLSFDVNSNNSTLLKQGYVMDKNGIITFIGWLQYPVDTQQISLNKIQTTQTWVFNQWSCGKYGIYDAFNGAPGPDPISQIFKAEPDVSSFPK